MKLTIEGDIVGILALMDTLVNRGREPENVLEKVRAYANQTAASASKADIAARNAEMALEEIKLIKEKP